MCRVHLPSQHVFDEVLASLVTAPDQWSARNIKEPHVLGDLPPSVKLGRIDISINFHVAFRWAHVLSEGHNVNVNLAQF